MPKDAMIEITRHTSPRMILQTPSGRSTFEIYHVDSLKVMIKVGTSNQIIKIPAQCFQDILTFLSNRGWVKIGAIHENVQEDTLDKFIKKYTHRSAASYVAPILEKANIIKIDRKKPAKVKLI